jgi:DNA-binding winged helix-turn-helix (wHTH) protein
MRYKNIKVTLNFNIKEVLKFGYSLNDNVITFRIPDENKNEQLLKCEIDNISNMNVQTMRILRGSK